jgi:hypothetical protein
MAKVRFISEKYLKDNSGIEDNVEETILNPVIDKAQLIYIEGVLGTALYKKLQQDVIDDSLAGKYLILMRDYIKPALVEAVIYESYPQIWSRITNKSVSTSNSDNAIPLSSDDIKFLQAGVRDNMEYLLQRVAKYLMANVSDFPEYSNPGSSIDTVRPRRNNLFGGIYLNRGKGSTGCNFGINLPD